VENAVLGIYLRKQSGDVLVDCCTPHHAAICAEHFNGCCWDRSGRTVMARVLTSATTASSQRAMAVRHGTNPSKALEPVKVMSSLSVPKPTDLSAAAAPFTPWVIQASATELTARSATVVEDIEKPASASSAASTAEGGSDCGEN